MRPPRSLRGSCRLLLTVALLGGCGGAEVPPPGVVAFIGEERVSYSSFEGYLERNVADDPAGLGSEALSALFDQFVEEELLWRLAKDEGDPVPGERRSDFVERLLRRARSEPVGEAEIVAFYRSNAGEFELPERIDLGQILSSDRAAAERIRERLQSGTGFETVVAELSGDEAVSQAWIQRDVARDHLPPAFVDLVFELPVGEVSDVVEADYGYLVFQVQARHEAQQLPLEAAAPAIRRTLLEQRGERTRAQLVEQARDRYNVRVFPRNLPFTYSPRQPS